jgi:antirestriction protein ArdC
LEVLRENNRAIVRAASHASKAADYILGFLPRDRPSEVGKPAGAALQMPGAITFEQFA